MTIFRNVVGAFLIDGIGRIQTISRTNDEGYVNKLVYFDLLKRDPGLSRAKRMRLDELKNQIKEWVESEENGQENMDGSAKDRLLNLITLCKHELLEICTARHKNTGRTEIALTELQAFVTGAHEKICSHLKLVDISINDKRCINTLRYSAALACARSVFEKEVIHAPEIYILSVKKEQIILNSLKMAIKIDLAPQESNEILALLMKDRAEYIQREVQKIDNHINNNYIIDYMGRAIASFEPVSEVFPVSASAVESSVAVGSDEKESRLITISLDSELPAHESSNKSNSFFPSIQANDDGSLSSLLVATTNPKGSECRVRNACRP